jgi:Fe-S oxidoreductase
VQEPVPVDIDFGDVSIAMRNLLRRGGHKKFNPGTAASMFFLNATDPSTIKLTKTLMIDWGYKAQRLAYRLARTTGIAKAQTKRPPATVGMPTLKAQVVHFINKPMPGGLPKRTSRALLDIEDDAVVPIIRDTRKVTDDSDAVFYFPGCGSERLFSQVGLATRRCSTTSVRRRCSRRVPVRGYPQTSAGNHDEGLRITRRTACCSIAWRTRSTIWTSRR